MIVSGTQAWAQLWALSGVLDIAELPLELVTGAHLVTTDSLDQRPQVLGLLLDL